MATAKKTAAKKAVAKKAVDGFPAAPVAAPGRWRGTGRS